MAKRKLKILDLATKIRLIEEIEQGKKKKKQIAEEFGIPFSTLSSIWGERENLKRRYSVPSVSGLMKKNKACMYEDIDKLVFKWFETMRDKNFPVSGTILKQKALDIAKSLNHSDFKASDGWLNRFKTRHCIIGKVLSGESASVDQDKCDQWKRQLSKLLCNYKLDDVFNVDETGIFYKCLPSRTLALKGQKCFGGKHSKERVTCLVGSNMSGSEKLKLLIIGKSQNPRCFRSIKSLSVDYLANKRSWMTGEIFSDWLIKLDAKFAKAKRKVLFIIDNCPAHPKEIQNKLKFIKLEFFPPNMTSVVQPMDMGIIQNLKTHYRRRILKKVLYVWETEKKEYKISLLDCVREISKAWIEDVTCSTIKNCFQKAGFKIHEDWDDEDDLPLASLLNNDVEDEIVSTWKCLQKNGYDVGCTDWKDYITVDENLLITQTLSPDDILAVEDISNPDEANDSDDDTESIDVSKPSKRDIENAIDTIQSTIERTENVPDEIHYSLFKLETFFKNKTRNVEKPQSKITDFFLK